jgi:ankyrin repeat protein
MSESLDGASDAAASSTSNIILRRQEFIQACANGDIDTVDKLIHRVYSVDMKDESTGMTPLMLASQNGHIHIVEKLVEKGADKNLQNNSGNTPLMLAIINKHEYIIRFLLEKGADTNEDMLFYVLNMYDNENRSTIVNLLLEHGVKQMPSSTGVTPLYLAVERRDIDTIRVLLDYPDARINDKNPPRRHTALIMALKKKYNDVAHLLIDAGADVNLSNGTFTPLQISIIDNNIEMVKRLLDEPEIIAHARASINTDGTHPLLFAIRHNRNEIFELMLAKGVTISPNDEAYDREYLDILKKDKMHAYMIQLAINAWKIKNGESVVSPSKPSMPFRWFRKNRISRRRASHRRRQESRRRSTRRRR